MSEVAYTRSALSASKFKKHKKINQGGIMKNRLSVTRSVLLVLALTLLGAGVAIAQSQVQTTDVLNFEVLSVDGNNLVVRDQNGTREVTVPEDFRFTVDGKPLSVHDLKAGMKGTATVTTTMSFRPVYVTEIKKGTVVRQVGSSVHVRTDQGVRWFKKSELDARGIKIYMDGKPVRVTDLEEGDQLSAMIVTQAEPEVITEKDVQASLAAAEVEAAAEAAAPPAEEPVAAAAETPVAEAPAEARRGSSRRCRNRSSHTDRGAQGSTAALDRADRDSRDCGVPADAQAQGPGVVLRKAPVHDTGVVL